MHLLLINFYLSPGQEFTYSSTNGTLITTGSVTASMLLSDNDTINIVSFGSDLIGDTYDSIPVNVTSFIKVWGKETESVVFYFSKDAHNGVYCVRIEITFNQAGIYKINAMVEPWADGSTQTLGLNQLFKTS